MALALTIERRLRSFSLKAALEVADGECLALFGHSGSGKSMTLRSIAGLDRPDAGRIDLDGRVVFDAARRVNIAPHLRNVGLVVQHYALFPHLTAAQNIAYGLVGWDAPARRRRIAELIELLRLDGLGERMPHELSGGQQQRVALARALARPVSALLLDEPFSALDEALRGDLRVELLRLRKELAVPILFVTHDLREAYLLADRIAVLDVGRILQIGAPDEILRRPLKHRVAQLTGVRNILIGESLADGRIEIGDLPFRVANPLAAGRAVHVVIRSERCLLRRVLPDEALPENCFVADVTEDLAFGNSHTLALAPVGAGPAIEVEVASHPYEVLGVAKRRRWVVELPWADLYAIPAEIESEDG